MSYPGSQQQLGLSDLQLLQQQLMFARLQELQKQQQLGQLGDGKPSSSLNNMALYAKHAAGGQITNLGSGSPFNASNMVASSNLNWMHHNGSSFVQGINRGSAYSHGEGLMMNPALQLSDSSYYGTQASSGRGNLENYSHMQGVPHSSVYMLSINSNKKPVSPLSASTNPFMVDKPHVPPGQGHSIDGSFMLRQGFQEKDLAGQASAQMINNGLPLKNFPPVKLDTSSKEYDRTDGQLNVSRFLHEQSKQTNDSQGTATLDPLEEKILFDTEDNRWDASLSKLAAIDTAELVGASSHKNYIDSFSSIHSGSWSALMQSAVAEASSSDTGIQEELSGLSFQNSDSCIRKQPTNIASNDHLHEKGIDGDLKSSSNNPRAPLSSVDSIQSNRCIPAKHPVNDWTDMNHQNSRDLSQGSRTSALSISGMIRNDFELIQPAVDSRSYVPVNNDTDQKEYKHLGHDHQSSSNPMAVDALYKRAAEIYVNQNRYRGEISSDSYNSKVSQAYVMQADHACLNAEDSESSARSSHKSQSQVLCVSSPGANNQQECVSHLKSNDIFPTDTDTTMKGKPNLSADVFSKGSSAFDSQNTSEQKVAVSHEAANPERFSFQSSLPGDSRLVNLGNDQRCQTWWTPSSFGHSFSPLQGTSLPEGCSGMPNIFGKTAIELSNIKSEKNSLEGLVSGHLHVNSQLDGKHISKVSDTSESIRRTFPEMSEQISSSSFSTTQDGYPLKNISSFGHEYTASRTLPVTQSAVIQGTYCAGVKPLNVWRDVPSQKNMIDLSSLAGLSSRTSVIGKDCGNVQKKSNFQTVDLLRGSESEEKILTISTDTSASAGSCINQQGYVSSGFVQKSSSETTLKALSTYSQSQLLHYAGNIKQQEDIGDTDLNKVDYNSSALYNLNKQRIPEFSGQLSLYEMHGMAKNTAGSRFKACLSGNNIIPPLSSGLSGSMMEISSGTSALQHMYRHEVPVFAQGYSNANNIVSDRINHVQNEYMKDRQILSLRDSATQIANKASANVRLHGTITHLDGIPASRTYGTLQSLANQMATCEQSLPSSVLHSDVTDLNVNRLKKRKSAMYECLPWHKEVMKTCKVLPDISKADQDWAEVTNRLIEKECMNEDERISKMRPALRAKRRLISTTKLIQLVFRPPPSTVFSLDASMEYEIVTYSTTKLALSDACSLANRARTDCNMSHEFGNMNRSGRMVDCLSNKAAELFERTKELETHIERLIKSMSFVDALVDCQDLERFCLINHYARYHSRVPDPWAANSESSPTGVASVKPFLKRYVSAVPLPSKLPEGVPCLSL